MTRKRDKKNETTEAGRRRSKPSQTAEGIAHRQTEEHRRLSILNALGVNAEIVLLEPLVIIPSTPLQLHRWASAASCNQNWFWSDRRINARVLLA